MEHGAKAIKEMKRHHQAYTNTHTHRFLLSMANNFSYLVSFCAQYTYNFLCVVWWADSFVRSCFVLLLHSTALITSNGSIHISMKEKKLGESLVPSIFHRFFSCGIHLPWYLSFTTCFSTSISNVFMSFLFFLFFLFLFRLCSNSSLFQFFHSGLMCHVFSTYLLIDTLTHTHFQNFICYGESVFFFVFFFVPSCTRTFPKNQTWIDGGTKQMLQLFYLPTKFDGRSGRKSDYLNCVTSASRQACAHGYFIDDMMFYAFEIIPFHLHDTLFPFGSKCLFFLSANRSALAKRACCCLYLPIRKSMGMWLFSAERKKTVFDTHSAMQAPFRPRSHLGFEYLPWKTKWHH